MRMAIACPCSDDFRVVCRREKKPGRRFGRKGLSFGGQGLRSRSVPLRMAGRCGVWRLDGKKGLYFERKFFNSTGIYSLASRASGRRRVHYRDGFESPRISKPKQGRALARPGFIQTIEGPDH